MLRRAAETAGGVLSPLRCVACSALKVEIEELAIHGEDPTERAFAAERKPER